MIEMVKMKSSTKEVAIFPCKLRATGKAAYIARSSSNADSYHIVHWDDVNVRWSCTCDAWGLCSHIKAVTANLRSEYYTAQVASDAHFAAALAGYTAALISWRATGPDDSGEARTAMLAGSQEVSALAAGNADRLHAVAQVRKQNGPRW